MAEPQPIRILPFDPDEHLSAVVGLCDAQGWKSFAEDLERTRRAFTAPGVCCVVAVRDGVVVGFAQMQSDGVLHAHLSCLVVDRRCRRRGLGRRLVEEALRRCGGRRVDLLAAEGSEPFYASFPHRTFSGYRVYPAG